MRFRELFVVAMCLALPAMAKLPSGPAPSNPPQGLTGGDWTQIRAEYERRRHAMFPDGDGFKARSFEQQWLARFDRRGFSVQPDEGSWRWGLELMGVTGKPRIMTEVNRLTYRWSPDLDEWFVNDTRGLEHGFTLRAPREIRLAVRGGLRAQLAGTAVEFVDASGTARIKYSGVAAWDADGRVLPARMQVGGGSVTLAVDDRGARYPITIDPIANQAYLKASNTGAGDFFGYSVAIAGETVVVGAYGEDSGAAGVNGNQSDNSVSGSGAAYVFVRSGATWTQQAYLKASNPGASDTFGISVAISGDTVVVGAPFEDSAATGVNGNQGDNSASAGGAAYIYVRSGGAWAHQAYLKASNTGVNDLFGFFVAISGETVAVQAYAEDSAATGVNGNPADNSATDSGASYVFVRTGAAWSQQAYLKASNTGADDQFGWTAALSGDTLVVTAFQEASAATGVNGNQADNSAFASGAAYVFVRSGGAWAQQAYLKASNTEAGDVFGFSAAVSGDTIVVGARTEDSAATGANGNQADNSLLDSGAAYVFVRSGAAWSQQAYLKASNPGVRDWFGRVVAIAGDTIAVAAFQEDSAATGVNGNGADNSAVDSGAAYVFARAGATWSQQAYLKASNTGAADFFGALVALSGDMVVVGAHFEDSAAIGANGNQGDNSALDSGAAYVYDGVAPSMNVNLTGPLAVPGATQTLVLRYTHNSGFAQLGVVNALINNFLNGDFACYIAYSQPLGVLYLVNDQGPGSGLSPGLVLGGAGAVSNSQCTITSAGSSAVGSGATLTLTLNVTYNTPFYGNKVIYAAAQDQIGNSTGWNTLGATIVPESAPTFPRSGAMTPATGTTSTATISFTYSDASSAANLQTGWVLINSAIDGRQACYIAYYAPGNNLYLYPDNGDGNQATNIVLTGTNTIENSQCLISAQGSSVTSSGGQLTVNLNYTFKPSFTGFKGIWTATQTVGGAQTSAWKPVGGWLLP